MSAPAPLTPRTGLPMPVDLSGLDLGILPCARVTAYDSAGEEVTQIRASSCAYQYVKSLQKALMGYVWCAVECGPPPWYAASSECPLLLVLCSMRCLAVAWFPGAFC